MELGGKIRALGLAFALAAGGMTAQAAPIKRKLLPPHRPEASIVVDDTTGAVLEADLAEALRHPASMSKIMTLMLAFDAVRDGRLTPQTVITLSRYAATREKSNLHMRAGQKIGIEDALQAIAVHSANDIATALAETLGGGSEKVFAAKMTAKAQAIGMKDTNFVNASGLPDDRQLTTARDMAVLCHHLIHDYPEFYHYFSQPVFSYHGRDYKNHNGLMTGYRHKGHFIPAYPGMDGIKTGLTNASGSNLAASAVRNGHRMVAIIFGGKDEVERDQHMAELLDNAFARVTAIDAKLANAKNVRPVLPAPHAPQTIIEPALPATQPDAPAQPPLRQDMPEPLPPLPPVLPRFGRPPMPGS